jgi:predicted TIM-barrel fold metal-dependent hydrolase
MLSRFPRVKVLPVEWQSASWVRPFVERLATADEQHPGLFEEVPLEVFHRNISVHAFRDTDPEGLVGLLGADRCLFGSDFPHPEGLADPLSFVDQIASLPIDEQAMVMGGNLDRLLMLGT